jgi:aspartyl-tRNA(Asn)/glutamyl-tRNA(Gln) amidotransferase subunit B
VSPQKIVEDQGLAQVSDSAALEQAIDRILETHPDELARYRNGQTKLMGFFVGQVMRATQGKGNPQIVNQLLKTKLEAPRSKS